MNRFKGKRFLWLTIFMGMAAVLLTSATKAQAATNIYRSVGVGQTAPLASGLTVTALDVQGSTGIFEAALPDEVGVGDVVVYDADLNDTMESVAFIHGRTSSTEYTLKAVDGTAPVQTDSFATTVWEVYRAYTSLENAISATENIGVPLALRDFDDFTGGQDLTNTSGGDWQWNIACYANGTTADTLTDGLHINGWTTDSDNYIKIYTPSLITESGTSQRHSGVWNTSKYHLVSDHEMATYSALEIEGVNVHIDGLQIYENDTVFSLKGIYVNNVGGSTWISNNIIRSGADNSDMGIHLYNGGLTSASNYFIWNNIVYDFISAGMVIEDPNGTAYAYNNTVYGVADADVCYRRTSGTLVAKNNIAQNCADGFNGTFQAASDYNLSSVAADAPGSNSVNSATLTFSNLAGDNFHLNAADDEAIAAGQTLSSDSFLPLTTDIDGASRLNWEIGADEMADVTAPTVNNVNSDKADGTYGVGEVIDIDVTFSEAVTSTGDVTVTLETGTTDRTCTFSVSNSTTGSCDYTVQDGDGSADLTVSSISGTIVDATENPVTNFVPTTNLAANKALVIETTPATPTPDPNSYVPNITINGVVASLGSQGTFYQRSATLIFSGQQNAVAGGQVKVYRKTKRLRNTAVDANGNWAISLRGLKNKTYLYKFVYVNAAGAVVNVSPYYRVHIDTKKPTINNRNSLNSRAGANLRIKAKDKTPITEYTYTFENQVTTGTSPYFTIPTETTKGNHVLRVRVKDSAGNYSATKRIKVRVR